MADGGANYADIWGRCRLLHVTPEHADHRLLRELADTIEPIPLTHAENGRSALEMLRGHCGRQDSPNLVLLGSRLPDLETVEFLHEVKGDERLRPIPIVVFSSYLSPRDPHAMYDAGAACVVERPDSIEQAHMILEALMRLWLVYARLPFCGEIW
jgi:CheY-like chemotaxis protein